MESICAHSGGGRGRVTNRGNVVSAYLMFHRFARALKIASRESGFAQIFGAALLLYTRALNAAA